MNRTFSYKAYPISDPAPALEAMQMLADAMRYGLTGEDRNKAKALAMSETPWATAISRDLLREWILTAWNHRNRVKPPADPGGTLGFSCVIPKMGDNMAGFSRLRAARFWRHPEDPDNIMRALIPIDRHGGQFELQMVVHRDIPADATLRRGAVHAHVSAAGQLTWRVQFNANLPDPQRRKGQAAGLDVGWRPFEDGSIRVLTLAAKGSATSHYVLPLDLVEDGTRVWLQTGTYRERARFSRRRLDYYRKLAVRLFREHPKVSELFIERLFFNRIPGSSKASLVRKVVAPGQLIKVIVERAEREGVHVTWVNPAKTTLRCANCGYLNPRSTRLVWTCKGCGSEWDQDENAAVNVRDNALKWGAIKKANSKRRKTPAKLTPGDHK